jgi:hypothetical protein
VSFGAADRRLRVAPGLAVVVPFRFQHMPTEDTPGWRGSRLLGLIPGGYVLLRTVGGRLGLLTNQLLRHRHGDAREAVVDLPPRPRHDLPLRCRDVPPETPPLPAVLSARFAPVPK